MLESVHLLIGIQLEGRYRNLCEGKEGLVWRRWRTGDEASAIGV